MEGWVSKGVDQVGCREVEIWTTLDAALVLQNRYNFLIRYKS
jgi:hypothetical protein